jgi:hypothetical protein
MYDSDRWGRVKVCTMQIDEREVSSHPYERHILLSFPIYLKCRYFYPPPSI